MSHNHPYQDKKVVVTTKHFKTSLFENEYSKSLNWKFHTEEVDTDLLGTFSGEIERTSPPLETAIKKARLGIANTGIPYGLASEGSIANDPAVPLLISDIETVVFLDEEKDLVISESYRSFEIVALRREVEVGEPLDEFLQKVDFPNHKLIAKVISDKNKVVAVKGLEGVSKLREAIAGLSKISNSGKVILEPDFRAHLSPSRQANIRSAAQLLLKRISQLCPACSSPGFGKITYEKGLNCSECGTFNESAVKSEDFNCVSCAHSEAGTIIATVLEPRFCPVCNP